MAGPSDFGPYRTNSIPDSLKPTFYERNREFPTIAIVMVILVFTLTVLGLTAGTVQYVVNGLAGYSVGEYSHYFIGVVGLFFFINMARG